MANDAFAENLPAQCPPAGAEEGALSNVYRLVSSANPDLSCFASHKALGKSQPKEYRGSECEWASCSLFSSPDKLLKIPGLRKRYQYVVRLDIPAKSGQHLAHKAHIHFWRYSGFDFISAITEVEEHKLP